MDGSNFPTPWQHERALRSTSERARLLAAAKHLRISADRCADVKGEGQLVIKLRAEAARLMQKRSRIKDDD